MLDTLPSTNNHQQFLGQTQTQVVYIYLRIKQKSKDKQTKNRKTRIPKSAK